MDTCLDYDNSNNNKFICTLHQEKTNANNIIVLFTSLILGNYDCADMIFAAKKL